MKLSCLLCAQVHGCNKLASRHVRLELAEARAVPSCDVCEKAPGKFSASCTNLPTQNSVKRGVDELALSFSELCLGAIF